MPYLMIQTNTSVDPSKRKDLLEDASRTVAELLGKPERFVMVALEPDTSMLFAGGADPLVYMELKSIGLPGERTRELSAALADFAAKHLDIGAERVYIEFADAERHMWGWNGGTFER